ncbi:MAG: recombinase family protein [Pseudomonadota bacterium]
MAQQDATNLRTRCAIYARSATQNPSGNTVESQIASLRAYTDEIGWEVTAEYQDRAASGNSLQHNAMLQLITDAGNGAFDVVIIQSLDRISRDAMLAEKFLKKISSLAVKAYSETDRTYLGPSAAMPQGRFTTVKFFIEATDKAKRVARRPL